MKYDHSSRQSRLALQAKVIMTLANAGFDEVSIEGTRERVFSRGCHGTDARVLVYTSIVDGETRGVGKDAIRVCAVRPMGKEAKERGIVKARRVNRTGEIESICDRMLNRMREVYGAARKHCLVECQPCKSCGASTFLSKRGNWVCADLCWKGES